MIDQILKMLQNDQVMSAVQNMLADKLAPMLLEMRQQLVSMVVGAPPPTFAAELAKEGFGGGDEASHAALWRAAVRAAQENKDALSR